MHPRNRQLVHNVMSSTIRETKFIYEKTQTRNIHSEGTQGNVVTSCLCMPNVSLQFVFSLSMKVPAMVEEIEKALSQDMCVVVGLQTTGEVMCLGGYLAGFLCYNTRDLYLLQQASLESEMEASKGEPDGFISICKEILQRFVREHFPTTAAPSDATKVTKAITNSHTH